VILPLPGRGIQGSEGLTIHDRLHLTLALANRQKDMNKLVITLCSTLAGSAGWWLGAHLGGIFTAFTISMVGTGAGVYAGKRVVDLWDF
jgi:hypothetical protein